MHTHHLLWTGGWDSTFRVLQLLLHTKNTVQPHYVIDPDRPSSGLEQATMAAIREEIAKIVPSNQLRSAAVTSLDEIPRDARLDAGWRRLKQIVPIGEQYAWLAAYVRLKGLDNMELCIHRDDKAHKLLQPFVVRSDTGGDWALASDAPGEYGLFKCFSFPVFDLTKVAMRKLAAKDGVSHILDRTWFCFTPIRGRYPCGRCNPCFFAFQERMGRRIGWRGLAAGVPIRLIKNVLPASLWRGLRVVTRGRRGAGVVDGGSA